MDLGEPAFGGLALGLPGGDPGGDGHISELSGGLLSIRSALLSGVVRAAGAALWEAAFCCFSLSFLFASRRRDLLDCTLGGCSPLWVTGGIGLGRLLVRCFAAGTASFSLVYFFGDLLGGISPLCSSPWPGPLALAWELPSCAVTCCGLALPLAALAVRGLASAVTCSLRGCCASSSLTLLLIGGGGVVMSGSRKACILDVDGACHAGGVCTSACTVNLVGSGALGPAIGAGALCLLGGAFRLSLPAWPMSSA